MLYNKDWTNVICEFRKTVQLNQLHHDFILENIIGDQMVRIFHVFSFNNLNTCFYKDGYCQLFALISNLLVPDHYIDTYQCFIYMSCSDD